MSVTTRRSDGATIVVVCAPASFPRHGTWRTHDVRFRNDVVLTEGNEMRPPPAMILWAARHAGSARGPGPAALPSALAGRGLSRRPKRRAHGHDERDMELQQFGR